VLASGKRRRLRAWIFTPGVSRYRFVYPCLSETTATAIEACEAAWGFYGGVFRTLIPDNTKSIVQDADPLEPRFTRAFLEYAQARGFRIEGDPGEFTLFAGDAVPALDGSLCLAVSPMDSARWGRSWRVDSFLAPGEAP